MIQKINEWFFYLVDRYMHQRYGDKKQQLFQDHPDTVIEIGAGYGANFRYLRSGTKVIAIEPKESFNELLKMRAAYYGIEVEIHNYGAETMNLKSESVKMVISSLVLCTVNNPVMAISEIRRVLEPEGRFVFLEHVKADHKSWICSVQKFTKKPWKWFFDGCHVNRNTGRILQNAFFSRVELERFNSKTIFVPIIPHVFGTAFK